MWGSKLHSYLTISLFTLSYKQLLKRVFFSTLSLASFFTTLSKTAFNNKYYYFKHAKLNVHIKQRTDEDMIQIKIYNSYKSNTIDSVFH